MVRNAPEPAGQGQGVQTDLMNLLDYHSDLDSDDDGTPSSPTLLTRQWEINAKRKLAEENLQLQVKKMLKMSNKKFPLGNVGDNIKIHVPDVDHG